MAADDQRKAQAGQVGWRFSNLVDSQGRLLNQADAMVANATVGSRSGRLYRSFWEGQVPAATAYHWVVRPPVGTHLFGVVRTSTVLEGRLDVTFLVGGSFSAVEESKDGFNFDESLEDIALTKFERVSGLTGASQRSSSAPIISPASGPVRAPSAQTAAGAHPKFTNTLFPVFEYSNPDATDPVNLWLDIVWEEVAAS